MNKSQKIVLISPFFFPEPISTGKFNTDMVLKLRDEGHHVTVFCSHPFYPEWKTKSSSKNIEGVDIVRGGKIIKYPKKPSLRRVVLEIWYAFFILKNIIKYQKKTDIIISVFPPSLALYFIAPFLKKDIKKIGIIHDLQIIYASQKKKLTNIIISSLIKRVEKYCFKNCEKLIFLSEEMKNVALEVYKIDEFKCKVQLPFISIKEEYSYNNLKDILPNNQHNIVYSGALGEKQNPIELYDVFDLLTRNLPNCNCYFFSQGPIYEKLKIKNNNSKIHFHSLVSKYEIHELYIRSSIQIVPQLTNTSKGSLPSKLPNILASGTKALVITDKNSDLEKLFKKYNLEKIVTSWDKKVIISSIKELLEERIDIDRQKEIAQDLFNIENLIREIVT